MEFKRKEEILGCIGKIHEISKKSKKVPKNLKLSYKIWRF